MCKRNKRNEEAAANASKSADAPKRAPQQDVEAPLLVKEGKTMNVTKEGEILVIIINAP